MAVNAIREHKPSQAREGREACVLGGMVFGVQTLHACMVKWSWTHMISLSLAVRLTSCPGAHSTAGSASFCDNMCRSNGSGEENVQGNCFLVCGTLQLHAFCIWSLPVTPESFWPLREQICSSYYSFRFKIIDVLWLFSPKLFH